MVSKEEFRTLVNDCSAQVLNTAVRILGNAEQAQDVHQEVFLAIWKRWHTYNGRTNWNAYLYRVTVRKETVWGQRGVPTTSVRDRFQWNPELPAGTFMPEIPEGFVVKEKN